jgi:hypothetical protein
LTDEPDSLEPLHPVAIQIARQPLTALIPRKNVDLLCMLHIHPFLTS